MSIFGWFLSDVRGLKFSMQSHLDQSKPQLGRCLETSGRFFDCHHNWEELLTFSKEDQGHSDAAVGGMGL